MYYLYDNLLKNPNLKRWISDELDLIQPQEIYYDDKTLVAAVCATVRIRLKRKSYYEFPTTEQWSRLLEGHRNKLYAYKSSDTTLTKDSRYIQTKETTIQQKRAGPQSYKEQHDLAQLSNRKKRSVYMLIAAIITAAAIMIALIALAFFNISGTKPDASHPMESVSPESTITPTQETTSTLEPLPTPESDQPESVQ